MTSVVRSPFRQALIVAAAIALAYAALSPWPRYAIGTIGDDGVYVVLGRAIANGDGYRNMHLVGQPAHAAYPPGVPLLFALLWRIGGGLGAVHALISVLNIVVCAATAGMLWWIARAKLDTSALVAAALVIGPFLLDAAIQYFSLTLSEPYFMVGWAATLVLYYRLRDQPALPVTPRALAGAALLGLVVAATASTRAQGIVLLPAVLLALALDRRRITVIASYLAGALLPVALWTAWRGPAALIDRVTTAPHLGWLPSGGVLQVLELAALSATTNAVRYVIRLADEVSIVRPLGMLLVTLWILLSIAGVIQLLRRHAVIALTTLACAAAVFIWPFHSLRFMVALLPFTGLIMARGVDMVLQASGSPRVRSVLRAVIVLLTLSVAARQLQIRLTAAEALRNNTPRWATPSHILPPLSRDIVMTSAWVERHTQPLDRIVAATTAGIHLRTGRPMLESNPPGSILPEFGPAPFAVPGRFLAQRLLQEHANVIVVESGSLPIARDVAILRETCPHTLMLLSDSTAEGAVLYPAYYRTRLDAACLRPLAQP